MRRMAFLILPVLLNLLFVGSLHSQDKSEDLDKALKKLGGEYEGPLADRYNGLGIADNVDKNEPTLLPSLSDDDIISLTKQDYSHDNENKLSENTHSYTIIAIVIAGFSAFGTIVSAFLTYLYVRYTSRILYVTWKNQQYTQRSQNRIIEQQSTIQHRAYLFDLIAGWNSQDMIQARIAVFQLAERVPRDADLKEAISDPDGNARWGQIALVAHFIERVVTCVENNFITKEDAVREFPQLRWWAERLMPSYMRTKIDQRIVDKFNYAILHFPEPLISAT